MSIILYPTNKNIVRLLLIFYVCVCVTIQLFIEN